MECEKCKSEKATIHLTEIIKDVKSEIHICENCAKQIGLNSKLSGFSLTISDMFSFLEPEEMKLSEKFSFENISDNSTTNDACIVCGKTYRDFSKTCRLGCQYCYQYLNDDLRSIILSYHKEKKHIGKIPFNIDENIKKPVEIVKLNVTNEKITDLNKKLEKAITEERYEDAAILRDLIKK